MFIECFHVHKNCAKQSRLFLLILTTSLSIDPVIIPMLSLRNLRNREVKGVQLISDRAGIQIFPIGFQLHTLIAPKGVKGELINQSTSAS